MKKIALLFLAFSAFLLGAAEVNKLSAKWQIYGKKSAAAGTVIQKNGQIDTFSKDRKSYCGVVQTVRLNQKKPSPIHFGGESRSVKASGQAKNNYCIYLDIVFADNTKIFGKTVCFSAGTNDWKKVTASYTPKKAIKSLRYYVLFRKLSGEASFRNLYLYSK